MRGNLPGADRTPATTRTPTTPRTLATARAPTASRTPATARAAGRPIGRAGHGVQSVECSRSVLTPPPISSSTIRSPAGLRTALPQSGQVKE